MPNPDTTPDNPCDARVQELRNQGVFRGLPAPAAVVGHQHVQRASKPPAGILASVSRPPHTPARLRRLAEKDKLTPKETAAWLDDWLTRINSTP